VLFLPLALLGRWLFELRGLFAAATLSNLLLGLAGFLWLGRVVRSSAAQIPPDLLNPRANG